MYLERFNLLHTSRAVNLLHRLAEFNALDSGGESKGTEGLLHILLTGTCLQKDTHVKKSFVMGMAS